jgi:SAM-dependent methyltransferase
MTAADRPRWNHNIHYYPLILAAVPDRCRLLDVGCGEGMLARQLRRLAPQVCALDADRASLGQARSQDPAGAVALVQADFLACPFARESFDMITSVAAVHHLDAAQALARMRDLLRPGGTLVIVGLARPSYPADLPWEAAALVAELGYRTRRRRWEQPAPTVWPPPHSYREIRALARRELPGVRYRRHLLWRYSLTWVKPA